jgi:hypothetical protein
MKKYFVIFLILSVYHSFAQEKAYFSVLFNDATPLGNFKSTNSINNSGFASGGSAIDLSFNYNIHKHFGFASMLREQITSFNSNGFAKTYAIDSIGTNNTYSYSGNMGGSYINVNLMGGAYYLIPFGKSEKFSIEARAMIGIQNSYRPDVSIQNNPPFSQYVFANPRIVLGERQISYSHANALAFSYLVGLGCRYNLTHKVSLFVRVDYNASNPSFKHITGTEVYTDHSGYNHTYASVQNYSIKMRSLNIGFGFGLRLFGKKEKIEKV